MKVILLRSLHFLVPMAFVLLFVAPLDTDFRYTFQWYAMIQTSDFYFDLPMPGILGMILLAQCPVYAIYLSWATEKGQLRQSVLLLLLIHLCAVETNMALRNWADIRDKRDHIVRFICR